VDVVSRIAAFHQAKVVRHVRTSAGQRRFGQPIGSIIVGDGSSPLKHLTSIGDGKAKGSDGNTYHIGKHEGQWAAITEDGDIVAGGKTEDEVYRNLDHRLGGGKGSAPKPESTTSYPGMHAATDEDKAAYKEKTGKSIPPAWTDVHIADDLDNAKILVRGKDSKGRGQTVYSAQHTEDQAEKKYTRVKAFSDHLPKIDKATEQDAMDNDHAAALLLIRRLGMRPGSNRDTGAEKEAHGATNLKVEHVAIDEDGTVNFDFTGKKGVHIQLSTKDPLIAAVLRKRLEERGGQPGVQLFDTDENKTRAYMKSTGVPDEFLLKDLRTVHANKVALREIAKRGDGVPKNQTEYRKWRKEIGVLVSNELGNTPTLALSSYINPTVFTPWRVDESWS
jgi:DNA topoisomerase-1